MLTSSWLKSQRQLIGCWTQVRLIRMLQNPPNLPIVPAPWRVRVRMVTPNLMMKAHTREFGKPSSKGNGHGELLMSSPRRPHCLPRIRFGYSGQIQRLSLAGGSPGAKLHGSNPGSLSVQTGVSLNHFNLNSRYAADRRSSSPPKTKGTSSILRTCRTRELGLYVGDCAKVLAVAAAR